MGNRAVAHLVDTSGGSLRRTLHRTGHVDNGERDDFVSPRDCRVDALLNNNVTVFDMSRSRIIDVWTEEVNGS